MASGDNVALCSSDGREVAMESISYDCAGKIMPLPNVSGNIPAKFIEHCKKHAQGGLEDQDADFIVDQAILSELDVIGRDSHKYGKFSLVSKGEGHVANTKDGTIDAPVLHRVYYWPILRVIIHALPHVFMLLQPVSARVMSTSLPGVPIQHNSFDYNYTNSP